MITALGRLGYVVVVLLALVGLSSAAGRFTSTAQYLGDPSSVVLPADPLFETFEARYFARPYLTLVHVVAGVLFMVLGPVQFWPAVRNRWLGFHRFAGRVFMIASLVGVISALIFVDRLPVFGSLSARVAVVFGGTMFLVCLVQGYRTIRRRQIAAHREWMIRTFAIGLGISTFRVLIPLLMVPPVGATFPEAWDTVTWLGFAINMIVAEAWINVTRRQPLVLPDRVAIHAPALQST